MNSQEELAASLQQLADALARRPSIVRHGDKPRTGSVQERREMTAPPLDVNANHSRCLLLASASRLAAPLVACEQRAATLPPYLPRCRTSAYR